MPDGKQHSAVEEVPNATASGETTPARIAAIARFANSRLIELPDSTPCHFRRAIFRNVSGFIRQPVLMTSRRVVRAAPLYNKPPFPVIYSQTEARKMAMAGHQAPTRRRTSIPKIAKAATHRSHCLSVRASFTASNSLIGYVRRYSTSGKLRIQRAGFISGNGPHRVLAEHKPEENVGWKALPYTSRRL